LRASVQLDVRPDAIHHNLALARTRSAGASVMAVVKTDAYGHGVGKLLSVFEQADALAVATVQEGLQLRAIGSDQPIVVLSRLDSADSVQTGIQADLCLVLHTPEQVGWYLETQVATRPVHSPASQSSPMPPVWLKLDTGMHRLGLDLAQYRACRDRIVSRYPDMRIGLMSHFSTANRVDDASVADQLRVFDSVASEHSGPCSIANSAAMLGVAASHYDWVRPGIMLYGSSPLDHESRDSLGLRSAMTLTARLLAIRSLAAGQPVGYGGTWSSPVDTSMGVVGIGYGDGYRRSIKTGTPVFIEGHRYPVAGRISMDTITVDLGASTSLQVGATVELWGDSVD